MGPLTMNQTNFNERTTTHSDSTRPNVFPHTKVKPSSPPPPLPSIPRGLGKWSGRFDSSVVAPSGRSRLVVLVWCRGQSRYSCMMGYRYVIRSFSHLDGGCSTMYVDTVWGLLLKDIAHASVPLNASPLLPSPLSSLFPLSSSSRV